MRLLLLVVLFYFPSSLLAEELKDPRTRDEDISGTEVTVDVKRNTDGLYVYSYTLISPVINIGKVHIFKVDLKCNDAPKYNWSRDYHELGTKNLGSFNIPKNIISPSIISIGTGRASSYGATVSGAAMWGLYDSPGYTNSGLEIISPFPPGLRSYQLVPAMTNSPDWDYPEEPDPTIPWLDDFTVTGMIAGPGCPGETPPVDAAFFPGSKGQAEPDSVNVLLTYSEPLLDRWHADESLKELTITIHYADNIDPASFQVEPGWVRELFKPIPGTSQSVTLPLKQTRNRFTLTVDVDRAKAPKDFGGFSQDVDAFEVRRDLTRGK